MTLVCVCVIVSPSPSLTRSRKVLTELELDGAVLSYSHNFAWLTGGGRLFINMAVDGNERSFPFFSRVDVDISVCALLTLQYLSCVLC